MQTGSRWHIEYYTTSRGASPVRDFINGLSVKERARTDHFLHLLADLGTELKLPHATPLKGHKPLWELRPMPHRLIYFLHTNHRFIILHAFTKKRNETERRHIETAERHMSDFLEREQ